MLISSNVLSPWVSPDISELWRLRWEHDTGPAWALELRYTLKHRTVYLILVYGTFSQTQLATNELSLASCWTCRNAKCPSLEAILAAWICKLCREPHFGILNNFLIRDLRLPRIDHMHEGLTTQQSCMHQWSPCLPAELLRSCCLERKWWNKTRLGLEK